MFVLAGALPKPSVCYINITVTTELFLDEEKNSDPQMNVEESLESVIWRLSSMFCSCRNWAWGLFSRWKWLCRLTRLLAALIVIFLSLAYEWSSGKLVSGIESSQTSDHKRQVLPSCRLTYASPLNLSMSLVISLNHLLLPPGNLPFS